LEADEEENRSEETAESPDIKESASRPGSDPIDDVRKDPGDREKKPEDKGDDVMTL
jgi:hypothetical protein